MRRRATVHGRGSSRLARQTRPGFSVRVRLTALCAVFFGVAVVTLATVGTAQAAVSGNPAQAAPANGCERPPARDDDSIHIIGCMIDPPEPVEGVAITVEDEPRPDSIRATVIVLEPLGSHNLLTVRSGDDTLKVATPPHVFRPVDSDVWLRLEPERIRWMDRETGDAIAVSAGKEVAAAPA